MATLLRQTTMSKDPQLEQDIERNLRLRDGAKRILSIAGNSIQRLDAEKTMLVSSARLVVSLRQLQQEKVLEANAAVSGRGILSSSPPDGDSSRVGRAKLCLSDIRIPLLWRDNSVLMANSTMTLNRLCDLNVPLSTPFGSLRPLSTSSDSSELSSDSYAAFCIVKVGNQIQETRLLCDIVPGTADLEFDDVLNFEGVTAGFHCIIELYAYPRSSSKSSFLRRKSSLDHTSSWRHTTLFDSLSPDDIKDIMSSADVSIMGTASTSSCFALVARYVARLNDVSDTVLAHTLDTASCLSHTMAFVTDQHSQAALRRDSTLKAPTPTVPPSSQSTGIHHSYFDESCEIPLFGPICFRLAAQPYSLERPLHRGLLWIRPLNVAPEQEAARLYDCELKGQCLFARLIGPAERSPAAKTPDVSPATSHRRQASAPAHASTAKSPLKVRLRVPNRWDLILKIDPDTELLDKAPTPRKVLLSPSSLTHSELDVLAETSPSLKTSPADEPKVSEDNDGLEEKAKGQRREHVSSDAPVLQVPTANGDGPEMEPARPVALTAVEDKQHSVPPAEAYPVSDQSGEKPPSEIPPAASEGSPDTGADNVTYDVVRATESEHDVTNHKPVSSRGTTTDSVLIPIEGEKHDDTCLPKPVDPISVTNIDCVSRNDRGSLVQVESSLEVCGTQSDWEETVGCDCAAHNVSPEVAAAVPCESLSGGNQNSEPAPSSPSHTNGGHCNEFAPKDTNEPKTGDEVDSEKCPNSTASEGGHLQEEFHTETGMPSISPPPTQIIDEDEPNETSGMPVASDEVALMRTRRASLTAGTALDKPNQISPHNCRSSSELSPNNEPAARPTSPPRFLCRPRRSLDSPNKYTRKKMVKTLTRSLDRSIPLFLSPSPTSLSPTAATTDHGRNWAYSRRLSLPESESTCISSQFSVGLISRPDKDSTEGSKHEVPATQTTTDDAYQTGSENVSLLSDPAVASAAAVTTDEKEDSSVLTTSRTDGGGGDGDEEKEETGSRPLPSARQSTSAIPSPLHRRLATFHVATNPVSGPDASFNKSTISEDLSVFKVVYEISAFEVFSRQDEKAAHEKEGDTTPTPMEGELKEEEADDELNCGGSTNAWFSAVKAHLKEQAEWGSRVFTKVMAIPEATSFTKKGSIIRASAFLDNLNIPEFGLGAVSTNRPSDMPITAL
ncbi:Cell division protein anillin [Sparganum proliferum]